MSTLTLEPEAAAPPLVGVEWVVEAFGCDPGSLRDLATVRPLCERILRELDLHAVGTGHWHRFPHPGGVTGLYLLTESHLACHTYPEHALATFNLYCCRPRLRWDWEGRLSEALGAERVMVRSLERGNPSPQPSPRSGEGEKNQSREATLAPPSLLGKGAGGLGSSLRREVRP